MNYNEDTLTSKERKTIDDSQFGLPEERKYPLTDAAHVKSAMAYFRYCDADKKHALAKRILKAAKKYDVKVSTMLQDFVIKVTRNWIIEACNPMNIAEPRRIPTRTACPYLLFCRIQEF